MRDLRRRSACGGRGCLAAKEVKINRVLLQDKVKVRARVALGGEF